MHEVAYLMEAKREISRKYLFKKVNNRILYWKIKKIKRF